MDKKAVCQKCNGYGKVKYIELFTVDQGEVWVRCPACNPQRRK